MDPRAAVTLRRWLAAVPTPNGAVREQPPHPASPRSADREPEAARAAERGVTLFVPLRRRWWSRGPVGWLLPLRTRRGVALDALGTRVWRACDGQRSVGQIVHDFADRQNLGFHEARLLVSTFLRQLTERSLLVLVFPREDSISPGDDSAENIKVGDFKKQDKPNHEVMNPTRDGEVR